MCVHPDDGTASAAKAAIAAEIVVGKLWVIVGSPIFCPCKNSVPQNFYDQIFYFTHSIFFTPWLSIQNVQRKWKVKNSLFLSFENFSKIFCSFFLLKNHIISFFLFCFCLKLSSFLLLSILRLCLLALEYILECSFYNVYIKSICNLAVFYFIYMKENVNVLPGGKKII